MGDLGVLVAGLSEWQRLSQHFGYEDKNTYRMIGIGPFPIEKNNCRLRLKTPREVAGVAGYA
jgi:hypothetical protein